MQAPSVQAGRCGLRSFGYSKPTVAKPRPIISHVSALNVYAVHKPFARAPLRGTTRRTAPPTLRATNPIPEVVKREQALQSNKLDSAVLKKVEDAVERLGCRVTVGDVASKAGLTLEEADGALQALAYDSLAALEVSEQGDVVYSFARNFRSTILSKSLWLRTRPVLEKARQVAGYIVRVAFGSSLIASVVVVWLTVLALLSARSDDNRNGNQQRQRSGYGGGGYYGGYRDARFFMDLTDLLYFWDPRFYRTTQAKLRTGQQLSFVEGIFSFVFGDGDPNETYDDERWALLGQMIRAKGGVVTAEEMAPYLDLPAQAVDPDATYRDESYVLPALLKFGGEPIVDERGNLLYSFKSLQASAIRDRAQAKPSFEVPLERPWAFTAATAGQQVGTVALGIANVVGVIVLSNLLADPQARYIAVRNGLGWATSALPWLQAYAGAFFAIPAARWFFNNARNRAIEARNALRDQAARLLNSGGGPRLQQKLASARAQGQRRVIDRQDAVYTTAEPAGGEATVGATPRVLADRDLSDWDARFERDRKTVRR